MTTTVKVAYVGLCHSRMFSVRAYTRQKQEMVIDAHAPAFAFSAKPARAGFMTIYGRLPCKVVSC